MRPVNLTPPEERRGKSDRLPARAGNLSYVVVAGLALGVLGLAVLALTSKQISDREADVSRLKQEETQAAARAEALRPFAEFRAVQESRAGTVTSLAQSRFDWSRVLRELSLVLPSDVWLINVTGTVTSEVSVSNGAEITSRDSVAGPALELIGCAPSQDSVAAFVAALEDIDGVTRVGVADSSLPDRSSGASAPTGQASEDDCRTRDFISRFEIVVAFDAVPAPATAVAPPPSVPAPLTPADGSQLADAQVQEASATSSAAEQTAKAQKAKDTFLPGG